MYARADGERLGVVAPLEHAVTHRHAPGLDLSSIRLRGLPSPAPTQTFRQTLVCVPEPALEASVWRKFWRKDSAASQTLAKCCAVRRSCSTAAAGCCLSQVRAARAHVSRRRVWICSGCTSLASSRWRRALSSSTVSRPPTRRICGNRVLLRATWQQRGTPSCLSEVGTLAGGSACERRHPA